jgi:hypothetical protein
LFYFTRWVKPSPKSTTGKSPVFLSLLCFFAASQLLFSGLRLGGGVPPPKPYLARHQHCPSAGGRPPGHTTIFAADVIQSLGPAVPTTLA